jgi:hypothetical protein
MIGNIVLFGERKMVLYGKIVHYDDYETAPSCPLLPMTRSFIAE